MRRSDGESSLRAWSLHVAGLLLVCTGYLFGVFDFVERELLDLRFRHMPQDASGTIVLVEIDGQSLDYMGVWPWPRQAHAEVLDKLIEANAARVAFDIDFSSPSNPESDAALERAFAAADGRVLLPVFQQLVRTADGGMGRRLTLPLERFRQHATLASINVRPDRDGRIRRLPFVQDIGGSLYPSVAAALSNAPPEHGSFIIDFGVRPQTIPRISFVDVLEGNFPPDFFVGRQVLIGATAVELGDQFAVPRWRTMPGPVLNTVAYESLFQGRALQEAPVWSVLALTAFVVFAGALLFSRFGWRGGLLVCLGGAGVLVAGSFVCQAVHRETVAIAPAGTALLLSFGVGLVSRLNRQGLRLLVESVNNMHRRALLDRVVDGSSDGLLIVDAAGEIVVTNGSAHKIFGWPSFDGVRPDALFDWRDADTRHALTPVLQMDFGLADGGLREVIGKNWDGETIPLELTVTHVVSAAQQRGVTAQEHLVWVVRDIRERKRIEQLKQQAMEDAMRAERAKADFLATMSHELRTPLNHIIGFSEMLETRMFGGLSEKQAEYVGNIAVSGRDLLHMISEILEYSAVKDRDYELSDDEVSPRDLIQDCIATMRERAGLASIRLLDATESSDGLPDIRVDVAKIQQVLTNLLSNGIKFSDEGGQVVLDVECDLDGVVFKVADQGPGMTPSQIEAALEPFARGEDAFRRTQDGYGLGLPLAKAIVDLHGGDVSIESEIDVGTKVLVRLPTARVVGA